MGKQEFKMAAQVCAFNNISYVTLFFLLPKFSYLQMNQCSNYCGNIEINCIRKAFVIEIIITSSWKTNFWAYDL